MLSKELLKQLQKYVDQYLISLEPIAEKYLECENMISYMPVEQEDITQFIENNKQPSFQSILFKHIDNAGIKDSDVYKKAGIDRRLFSKIRTNDDYHPSKNTVISLSFALELDLEEVHELIGAVGYALSNSETFDLVIKFCVERKIYNIHDVNLALDYFSLDPLSGVVR